MPEVQQIVFRLETPDQTREFDTLPPALDWHEKKLLEYGHLDGFYIRWSVGVKGDSRKG